MASKSSQITRKRSPFSKTLCDFTIAFSSSALDGTGYNAKHLILVIYSKATPPKVQHPYTPHPQSIEMANIYSFVKSQVPSMNNDQVMALLVIYSNATPPGCHTPYIPHPLCIEMSNIYSYVKSQVPSIKNG